MNIILRAINKGKRVFKNLKTVQLIEYIFSKKKPQLNKDDLKHFAKSTNLMIVSHPDDETIFGATETLSKDYCVLCLTNKKHPVRYKNFTDAMKICNASYLILDYPDLYKKDTPHNWNNQVKSISLDIETVIKSNNWNTIVTHNPAGEYGHIHHKKLSRIVTKVAKRNNKYDKLYYFGNFFNKNSVPDNVKKVDDLKLLEKRSKILNLYNENQDLAVASYSHMSSYYTIQKAKDFNNRTK